ncbi:MAG: hypothetical protein JWN08_1416 [Frankiales bacterium]|jgi:hypothetical protein|nr:hypothetical protein [Frankiales bacterium]
MDSTEQGRASETALSAFAQELRLRLVEAEASVQAARHLDDPLLLQIAEGDLADMRALASRNDLDPEHDLAAVAEPPAVVTPRD